MPVKAEKNSKNELAGQYSISRNTLNRWLKYLFLNWCDLMNKRHEPDYQAFETYDTKQKLLTPLQIKIFKKHYGEPT